MKRREKDAVALLLVGVVALALVPIARAFVVTHLWAWFIVPLGVEPIGMAHAWGLAILAGMFTATGKGNDEEVSPWVVLAVAVFVQPAIVLFLGMLASALMAS